MIVVLFAVFWLLLVRPQRKRALEQRELLSAIEPGDEIVSTGGLFGIVKAVEGEELHVEIAEGLTVRMARQAVAGLVERDEEEEEQEPEAGRGDEESARAAADPS